MLWEFVLGPWTEKNVSTGLGEQKAFTDFFMKKKNCIWRLRM